MPTSGSSAGSTPFGFATPATVPLSSTQGPALTRFIDVGAGDYQIDATVGQFASMPSTRQRVLLVVQTILGSATAAQGLGIRRPPKIDGAFEVAMVANVREAFSRLTDVEQIIRLDEIAVEQVSSGRVQLTINWTDLEALTPDATQSVVKEF